jgi:hypothetical protein
MARGSNQTLNQWLDSHGYHHSHARKKKPHPYVVSSRLAHARSRVDEGELERYSKYELEGMPTISSGQADDLKVDDEIDGIPTRWWLSRMTIEDGEKHAVHVEQRIDGRWTIVHDYGRPDRSADRSAADWANARKKKSATGREIFAAKERDHHITTAGRLALRADQFALPPGPEEKRRGIKGRLPIDTLKRGRNALTRAAQMRKRGHISSAELATARSRVHAAWPSIEVSE